MHIYFPLWFLISSTHIRTILAKPFVVHSVIIFSPVFPLLWDGLADELTDCRHSVGDASARAGELVVMNCYVMVIS